MQEILYMALVLHKYYNLYVLFTLIHFKDHSLNVLNELLHLLSKVYDIHIYTYVHNHVSL
jgi:hypothetical protein